MTTKKEAQSFKQYIVDKRHSQRIYEQEIDMKFFEDKYDMPFIKNPKYQLRTGYVSGMLNTVASQMIGNNPRCFTKPRSDNNEKTKEAADRVAAEGNRWLRAWLRTYRNPYRKTFKMVNAVGQAWIYMVHDERLLRMDDWQKKEPDSIPVVPIFHHPTVVFCEPTEIDANGQPQRVVVSFKRMAGDIIHDHPDKAKLFRGKYENDTDLIDYFLYVDDTLVYAEAGGVTIVDKPNIYKEVTFVQIDTGWGIETADKDPALMAFSRSRMMRDLIVETSTMNSDIATSAHREAHNTQTVILPAGEEKPGDMLDGYKHQADDSVNVIVLPPGSEWRQDAPLKLSSDVYAHVAMLENKMNNNFPGVLQGGVAPSGREGDRASGSAHSIYDSPMENNNILWATAIDLGMKICSKVAGMKPPKLQKGDADSYCELTVDLSKEDPIALSRRTAEGEALWTRGVIDFEEFHMNYMGKTKDEATKAKAKVWIERAMRESPAFQQLIIQTAAEEMGKEEELAQIEAELQGGAISPVPKTGSRGGEPRNRNIKTPLGAEMADQAAFHEPRERA